MQTETTKRTHRGGIVADLLRVLALVSVLVTVPTQRTRPACP